MSVFISIKYEDCIQLLTDGAGYDRDKVIVSIMRKVWHSQCCPLAMTGRGNSAMVQKVAQEAIAFCNKSGSVDQTVDFLSSMADRLKERRSQIDAENLHFELFVALHSQTYGFAHAVMCTFDGNGVEPYVWHPQPDIVRACPDIDPSEIDMTIPPTDPKFLERHGVQLMEVMRRKEKPDDDALSVNGMSERYGSVCGGLATLTTIKKSGATSRNLKVWPDKIGEKVTPR